MESSMVAHRGSRSLKRETTSRSWRTSQQVRVRCHSQMAAIAKFQVDSSALKRGRTLAASGSPPMIGVRRTSARSHLAHRSESAGPGVLRSMAEAVVAG